MSTSPNLARAFYFLLGIAVPILAFLELTMDPLYWDSFVRSFSFHINILSAPLLLMVWCFVPARLRVRSLIWVQYAILAHIVAIIADFCIFIIFNNNDHIVGIAFVCVPLDLLALLLVPWKRVSDNSKRAFAIAIRISAIIVFLGSFGTAGVVIGQAERLANGRPYCIQVHNPYTYFDYYTPSALDLTAWKMRGYEIQTLDESHFSTWLHSLLVVENGDGYDVRNWSYFALTFRHEVGASFLSPGISPRINHTALTTQLKHCELKPHYALHLRLFDPDGQPEPKEEK